MGPREVWNILWNEDGSVEALERVVIWFQEGMNQYLIPIILCCMGTTGFIFWQLRWYTALLVYVCSSSLITLIIVVLMWYLRNGITELKGTQEMTDKLLEILRLLKEKELQRRAAKEGRVDPMAELGKQL
mmetsp:Transcript_36942/g.104246  ORF Transcript_36942/g.104246 Transcript_36942/m.104246 type:complete len:130 (+) Transcript_36942:266-655(+)